MSEDRYYLTTDIDDESNTVIAVISIGSPQKGDKKVLVCSVERFDINDDTDYDIQKWFEEQIRLEPWVIRQ